MPRPTKQLKKIKDSENLDGFAYVTCDSYKIHVNVEKLWKEAIGLTKSKSSAIDSFARLFAKTYVHELLHYLLRQRYRGHIKYAYGEEYLIYYLLGDRWTKYTMEYYKNENS